MKSEVIEKLKFSEYLKLPGVHSSELKHMLISPKLYAHKQLRPMQDNDTLRVGRAGHTAILEPQRFLGEYCQWETERTDPETGEVKKAIRRGKVWDEFQAANANKTILTPAQFEAALAMRDAVREHPIAGPLVKGIGQNELSLRWTHERTGIDMKGRIDRLVHGQALVDIKTSADPTPQAFARTAFNLHYFLQMALYSDGVEACGLGTPAVKIIAVQSVAPFDVGVYDIEIEELEFGREQYNAALDRLIECRKTNVWPGFAETGALPLRRPAWAVPAGDDGVTDFGAEVIA